MNTTKVSLKSRFIFLKQKMRKKPESRKMGKKLFFSRIKTNLFLKRVHNCCCCWSCLSSSNTFYKVFVLPTIVLFRPRLFFCTDNSRWRHAALLQLVQKFCRRSNFEHVSVLDFRNRVSSGSRWFRLPTSWNAKWPRVTRWNWMDWVRVSG